MMRKKDSKPLPPARHVFFWGGEGTEHLDLSGIVSALFGKPSLPRPENFVRERPHPKSAAMVEILKSGHRLMAYMGFANCRICGVTLGTADLHGYGFVWPEQAEHYVLAHNVWPPGADDLLKAAGK